MTDLEKSTVKAYAKYNDMDPIEIAWHKEEYTKTATYQLLELILSIKNTASGAFEELKEAFRGEKP
jgi:hypothetical protein